MVGGGGEVSSVAALGALAMHCTYDQSINGVSGTVFSITELDRATFDACINPLYTVTLTVAVFRPLHIVSQA
jgi:hypothetical protein